MIVLWDVGESSSDLTLEYAVELPGKPGDGDTFAFDWVVESEDGQRSVTGDDTVTVVADPTSPNQSRTNWCGDTVAARRFAFVAKRPPYSSVGGLRLDARFDARPTGCVVSA